MVRARISIRSALLLAFGGLVVLLASLLASSWVSNEARLVQNLAAPIVELAQENAQTRIEALVEPIRVELGESLRMLRRGSLPRRDPATAKDALLPGMYELQGVGSMMLGDESGYQLLIMRYDERVTGSPLLANVQLPQGYEGQTLYCTREFDLQRWGQRSLWTLWSENGREALATWDVELPDYDPRSRPWLTEAVARLREVEARGQAPDLENLLVWTEPYTLFTSKTNGMSAALAAREPSGTIAVVAYDLLLEDLDAYTREFHPTEHGKAFVLAEDGRGVALPCDHLLGMGAERARLQLAPLSALEAAGVGGLGQGLLDQYRSGQAFGSYEAGGSRWYGSLRPFELGGGKRLLVGVALPSSELLALAGFAPLRIAMVTGLGLLAALALAFWLSGRLSTPLRALVEDSERIGRLDLTPQPLRASRLAELGNLERSLASTRTALHHNLQARDAARTELATSEARFRATFEQAAVGLLHVAPDGRVLLANRKMCALLGHSAEELQRLRVQDFTHEDDWAADEARMARLLAGPDATAAWEKRYVLRDGQERWVRLSTRLLRDEQGQPLYFVTAVLDIHEQRQLEANLRQSQKLEAVGQLAGGVAHDFNNLLTVITGYVRMVIARLASDDPAREDLKHVVKAGDDAAVLVKQLLTFARREAPAPVVLDLLRHVEESQPILARLLGADTVLTVHAGGGPHHVLMNPGQLQQLLVNLAVNAHDAMPTGGRMAIALARVRDASGRAWIELEVSDTGEGMSAEVRAHAFEPFYTTKEVGRGTGLGLATCYGIVRQAQGEIRLESEPGKGTRFVIRLPASEARPALPTPPPSEEPRARGTVLLVEDEPGIRTLAERVLTADGLRVLSAPDGAAALELVRAGPAPDLVVTDVIMPGMHGGELAERIRALFPGVLVLYVSGHPARVLSGKVPEGAHLLAKPYTPEELVQRVRALLTRTTPVG